MAYVNGILLGDCALCHTYWRKKRGRAVGKQVDPIWTNVVCLVPALLTPRELLNGLSIWANFTTQGTSTCQFV